MLLEMVFFPMPVRKDCQERTFADVRVFTSNHNNSIACYKKHKKIKYREYEHRVFVEMNSHLHTSCALCNWKYGEPGN